MEQVPPPASPPALGCPWALLQGEAAVPQGALRRGLLPFREISDLCYLKEKHGEKPVRIRRGRKGPHSHREAPGRVQEVWRWVGGPWDHTPRTGRAHRAGRAGAPAFGGHHQELMRGINHLSAYRVTFEVVGME